MTSTNYSGWNKQFTAQVTITQRIDKEILQEACQILYQRIVDRTPVGNPALWNPPIYPKGYNPGSLKEAWQIKKDGEGYIISNNLPYAYRVETGWSTQAPSGMMRISVKEFNSILDEVARRRKK